MNPEFVAPAMRWLGIDKKTPIDVAVESLTRLRLMYDDFRQKKEVENFDSFLQIARSELPATGGYGFKEWVKSDMRIMNDIPFWKRLGHSRLRSRLFVTIIPCIIVLLVGILWSDSSMVVPHEFTWTVLAVFSGVLLMILVLYSYVCRVRAYPSPRRFYRVMAERGSMFGLGDFSFAYTMVFVMGLDRLMFETSWGFFHISLMVLVIISLAYTCFFELLPDVKRENEKYSQQYSQIRNYFADLQ